MTNRTYYSERTWRQPVALADCPTCHNARIEGQQCVACRNTGKVTVDRVCAVCHNWLSRCTCGPKQTTAKRVHKGKLKRLK